jgi:addiction module RelB/DinJ family antitoxin
MIPVAEKCLDANSRTDPRLARPRFQISRTDPRSIHGLGLEVCAQMGHICVMAKAAILRARVDAENKASAEEVFATLGLSLGDALNLFLAQVSIQKGIPFPLTTRPHLDLENATIEEIEHRYQDRIPNARTRAALREKTSPARRHQSTSQLLRALKA